MVNTLGSNIGGNRGNDFPTGMNYPFSDEEKVSNSLSDRKPNEVRIVGVQNYPESVMMFRTNEIDEEVKELRNKPNQSFANSSFDNINDTFGHEKAKEESKNKIVIKKTAKNLFSSLDDRAESLEDNDSSRFPPISSRRSVKFANDNYMRSLDPLDEIAGDINFEDDPINKPQQLNSEKHKHLFLTDGVSG